MPKTFLLLVLTLGLGLSARADLKLGKLHEIQNFDPQKAEVPGDLDVVHAIHETLYQYRYTEGSRILEPELAADLPKRSADGLTWTIPIRTDAHTEGSKRFLTPADVVYTLKRIADPETQAKGWWLIEGKIKGLDAFRENLANAKTPAERERAFSASVDGLQVKAPAFLVLRLTHSYPQLMHALAQVQLSPVSPEQVKSGNFAAGTGPFRIETPASHGAFRLVRNADYHPDFYPFRSSGNRLVKGKSLPLTDSIAVLTEHDEDQAWNDLVSGKIDVLNEPIAFGEKKQLQAKVQGIQTVENQNSTLMLLFNTSDPILKSLETRRKIQKALSVLDLKTLLQEKDTFPAHGLVPPSLSNAKLPTGKTETPTAFKPAIELKLTIQGSGSQARQLGEGLKSSLEAIGVRVTLGYFSPQDLVDGLAKGEFQMALLLWTADYPDARSFLRLFYSHNIPPRGPGYSRYASAEYDRLYEHFIRADGEAQKQEWLTRLEAQLKTDVPVIPLLYVNELTLARPEILNVLGGFPFRNELKYLEILKTVSEQEIKYHTPS
jgi:ABC-type oligopeptide transport system substrate-binding subunit